MQTNQYIKDFSAKLDRAGEGSIVTVVLSTSIATLNSEVKVQVAYPGISLDLGQKPTMNAQRTIVVLNFKCATKTEYPCLLSCIGDSVVLIRNINKTIASQLAKRRIEIYDDNVWIQRIVDDRVYLGVQKARSDNENPQAEIRQLTVVARIAGASLIVTSIDPYS